jgi:hypothetical protein
MDRIPAHTHRVAHFTTASILLSMLREGTLSEGDPGNQGSAFIVRIALTGWGAWSYAGAYQSSASTVRADGDRALD